MIIIMNIVCCTLNKMCSLKHKPAQRIFNYILRDDRYNVHTTLNRALTQVKEIIICKQNKTKIN